MRYSVEYKENEAGDILFRTFKGTVTMNDIISSWEDNINNRLISKDHLGSISDYRKAKLQIELEDLNKFANFYKKNIHLFKNMKLGVISNNPDIALPVYFQMHHSEIQLKSFSTIEAAIIWIRQ